MNAGGRTPEGVRSIKANAADRKDS
jgi:hypothetical protein